LNIRTAPRVSVVIPTYNHGHFLGRALKSLLDQSYSNWEAIVIDSQSTDNTDEVMEFFIDPRIKYLKTKIIGVIAASRNVGIRAAKGEWIAFLDSDDWWKENKLEVCFNYINHQVDLVYHDMEIKYNKPGSFKRKKTKNRQLKKPILTDLLLGNNAISNSSVVVRKKLLDKIGGLDERKELVAVEDYHTWLRIAQLTDKFFYLPHSLGFYLKHDQNISRKDMSQPSKHAVSEFVEVLNPQQQLKLEANLRYKSGYFNYSNFHYDEAKKDLFFVLKNGYNSLKIRSLIMIAIIIFKLHL